MNRDFHYVFVIFDNRYYVITRDPGDYQLSEYDDDSSTAKSSESLSEEDGAIRDMQNEELGFLFASRRTRSGRIVKTTNNA